LIFTRLWHNYLALFVRGHTCAIEIGHGLH